MSTDGVFSDYTEVFRADRERAESALVRGIPFHVLQLPEGPLADLGAGGGLGTVALAEAFPERDILAVEPDRTARAVLVSRVADHGLADRVTVYGDEVEIADLPSLAGAIGIHLLCQLTDGGIPSFLSRMDFLLEDDGALLVDSCFGPSTAEEHGLALEHAQRFGRRDYQHWTSAEVYGGKLRITHLFKTLENGHPVREERSVSEFVPWLRVEVEEMIAAAGFAIEPVGERYLVLSRA